MGNARGMTEISRASRKESFGKRPPNYIYGKIKPLPEPRKSTKEGRGIIPILSLLVPFLCLVDASYWLNTTEVRKYGNSVDTIFRQRRARQKQRRVENGSGEQIKNN